VPRLGAWVRCGVGARTAVPGGPTAAPRRGARLGPMARALAAALLPSAARRAALAPARAGRLAALQQASGAARVRAAAMLVRAGRLLANAAPGAAITRAAILSSVAKGGRAPLAAGAGALPRGRPAALAPAAARQGGGGPRRAGRRWGAALQQGVQQRTRALHIQRVQALRGQHALQRACARARLTLTLRRCAARGACRDAPARCPLALRRRTGVWPATKAGS